MIFLNAIEFAIEDTSDIPILCRLIYSQRESLHLAPKTEALSSG